MSIASIVSTFAYIFICFQVQFTACVPDRPGLGAVCLHDTHLKFDFRWLCLTHGSLMSFRQRQRFIWVPWTSTLKTLSFIFLLFMSGRFAAWLPGLWGTPSRPLFPVFDGLPPSRSRVSVAWRTSTFCPPLGLFSDLELYLFLPWLIDVFHSSVVWTVPITEGRTNQTQVQHLICFDLHCYRNFEKQPQLSLFL